MHNPFATLPVPTPDPLFAIAAEAQAAGKAAINGTIGMYMDEQGKVVVFPSVQRAIADIAPTLPTLSYGYPPLLGLPEFRSAVERLIFGEKHPYTVASIASTGGTGALAINLRLLKMLVPSGNIIVQSPLWANHPPLCTSAGFTMIDVPYLKDGRPTVEPIIGKLHESKDSVGILLQVGAHNPTGLDLTDAQWKELIDVIKTKECTVLLDFAYQGLKEGIDEDAAPIHLFVQAGIPTLVTWSAAKNHALYSLRPGLACAVVPDAKMKAIVETHYSRITRMLHSVSSTMGQMIVARVQTQYRAAWEEDLKAARAIINRKRQMMIDALPEPFKTALRGYGLFAMLPLTSAQVQRLKNEENVFLAHDGRINVAGIPEARIPEFCEKVGKVLDRKKM